MVFLREFALDLKEVVAFTLLNTYVSIHPLIRIIKSRKLYIREGGIFTFNFLRNEKSNFFFFFFFIALRWKFYQKSVSSLTLHEIFPCSTIFLPIRISTVIISYNWNVWKFGSKNWKHPSKSYYIAWLRFNYPPLPSSPCSRSEATVHYRSWASRETRPPCPRTCTRIR